MTNSRTRFGVPLETTFDDFGTQKGAQKGDLILVVVPLGAPLAPHPILEHKTCAQSVPKSALREQK